MLKTARPAAHSRTSSSMISSVLDNLPAGVLQPNCLSKAAVLGICTKRASHQDDREAWFYGGAQHLMGTGCDVVFFVPPGPEKVLL